MPAFNGRFEISAWAGIPVLAWAGAVVAFLGFTTAALFPFLLARIICVLFGVCGLAFFVTIRHLGEDLPFWKDKRRHRSQQHLITQDALRDDFRH